MKLKDLLFEGNAKGWILKRPAMLKYNMKRVKGGVPKALYTSDKSYAKVPKGTYILSLPGGLFAVNTKEKFAFQITSDGGTLGAQDKLKSSDVSAVSNAPSFSEWRSYWKR
jgi:hypothetical protein